MTWTRTKATGSGKLSYRLSIAGWPYEFVSTRAQATGSGRRRLSGLNTEGLRLEDKLDPITGKLKLSGLDLKIADIGELPTLALAGRPTVSAYIESTLNSSATTVTVTSTTGFASSGTIWIDSECITYSGTTATTFTGCTRGAYDTQASYHYVDLTAELRYPEVTDYPRLMRGRRARLYAYGAGDSSTGDGTQIWLGVVSGEPRYDGTSWSITIDPITSVLDQEVAGDLSQPLYPRGIYFPSGAAFGFRIYESSSNVGIGSTTDSNISKTATVGPVSGFYETQDAFCTAIQALIDTAQSVASMTTKLRIVSDGPDGYHFEVLTAGAGSVYYLTIGEVFPRATEPRFAERFGVARVTAESGAPATLAADSAYRIDGATEFVAGETTYTGLGTVPRAAHHGHGLVDSTFEDGTGTYPTGRIYLDGVTAIPSYTTRVLIKWSGGDETEYPIASSSTSSRYIQILASDDAEVPAGFTGDAAPEIRLGRDYNAGIGDPTNSIYDLLNTLVSSSPTYAMAGAQPQLESGDFDLTVWSSAFAGMPRYIRYRAFSFFSPIKLIELVRADLQLAGFFLALDSSGRMVPKEIRLPLATDNASRTIDASEIITETLPTYERAGLGLINTVVVKTGYVPSEDEWKGPAVIVRDVQARGEAPTSQKLTIEPRSRDPWGTGRQHALDLIGSAQRLLSVFAQPYASSTFEVPLTCLDATTVGSTIKVTTKHIPADDGTKGVTSRAAWVVGREQHLNEARCRLTVLFSSVRAGGYAPEARVSSQSNNSGNSWAIACNTGHFPSGTEADNWFAVNDKVRVYKWDSTSLGTITGTVTAVSGNVVDVTLDSAWTPGSDSWVLGYGATSAPQQTSQRIFAAIADSTARLTYDSANDTAAFQFTG